ncbi:MULTISPECIES: DUF6509 family protein [Paenibacillus]|uniref:DUF6509 family protein n=1 Tax=Paenibacillus TaxID=44249 RepID=UPI000887583B|nr:MULTISPECIES: DUF6509 family protein [Paenibacillus]NTZ17660.1 pullulanase [Paenibacillus sp. JMULE4]GCL70527.1 hypothetical protein PN4B1_04290 [Paenibacillus naphthalenovorans]SDH79370.1 hypothetical protein SAMN05421868_101132 [Paenibacillus naphthalenovorans]
MLTIIGHKVEWIKDPFGILSGERYEFLLDVEVSEDDELYSENGLYIRVIYRVDENKTNLVKYEIFEKTTERYLEFDLEEDEEQTVDAYCKEHLPKAVK